MERLLEVKEVRKSYTNKLGEELLVLDSISLDIYKNDFIAIVGASGSGKSTLLNIMASIDNVDSGDVVYFGEGNPVKLNNLSDEKLSKIRNSEFGFVFQFHYLLPEFDAIENIMMPAIIAGESKQSAQEKAHKLLNKIGLSQRAKHKPDELSGGEQQRIAIARSLINSPKIIFADEPTGNLDEYNSKLVIDLLTQLQEEEGLTIVVATHSQEVARTSKKTHQIKDKKINII